MALSEDLVLHLPADGRACACVRDCGRTVGRSAVRACPCHPGPQVAPARGRGVGEVRTLPVILVHISALPHREVPQ